MIKLKNAAEISKIKDSCAILVEALQALKKLVGAGITTEELDREARSFIERRGAKPAFLGYLDYPASLCVSINEEVIHGRPGKTKLKEGDIVSLDLGVNLHGYFGDAALPLFLNEGLAMYMSVVNDPPLGPLLWKDLLA